MTPKAQDTITLATANVATGGSMFAGLMTYLNEFAPAIGAIGVISSAIIALIFYILNYRLNAKRQQTREQMMADIKNQIKTEIDSEEVRCLIDGITDRRHPRH